MNKYAYLYYMNKNSPIQNYLALTIAMTVSFFLTAFGQGAHNTGMDYLVLLIVPVGITLVTLALYFISRSFTKKSNWIISLFGIILLLVYGIRIFFNL